MTDLDHIAAALERLVDSSGGDEWVPARIVVTAVGAPPRRGRFVACVASGELSADGLAPRPIELRFAVRRDRWPEVGTVYPATMIAGLPETAEIDWDRVR